MTIQPNPECKKRNPKEGQNIQIDDKFWADLMEKVEENRGLMQIEEVPLYEAEEIPQKIDRPGFKIEWDSIKASPKVAEAGWGLGSVLGVGANKILYVCVQGATFSLLMLGAFFVHFFSINVNINKQRFAQYENPHIHRRKPKDKHRTQPKVNNIKINNIINIQQ